MSEIYACQKCIHALSELYNDYICFADFPGSCGLNILLKKS